MAPNLCPDIEYAHQLVYDLKMNELQFILDSVKQNKSGNKQVLRKRILNLLAASSSKTKTLRQKIVQVYGSRTQQPALHFNPLPSSQQHTSRTQRQPSIYDQGSSSFNNFVHAPINHMPRNKIIQFEHLPFFKSMQTLLEPMYCQTNIDTANFTGLYFLTDSVRHSIMQSWNITKQAYKVQIILRFVQIELKENVTERLPYNIKVSVNGQECKLPALNMPTKAGITPWRNNVPIDITQQTDLRNCLQNELKITWSEEPHEYMAGVYVAEKLTSDELLEKLKEKPMRKCEKTKELIKKSMESDTDMGIDSMFATLLDPLSRTRMKLPARGIHCIHFQCFDAIQFLQMNEQKPTWACPLCKKNVKFENVEVDEFFLNILQSPNLSKTCENVILLKDGTWSEKKNRKFSNSSVSSSPSNKQVEVYTLSDTDEDFDSEEKHSIKRTKNIPSQNNRPSVKTEHLLLETESRTKLNNKNSSENDLVLDLSIKNGPIASTSGYNPPKVKVNEHSVPSKPTASSTILNNFYLPNLTITETNSKISKADTGTRKNNNRKEKGSVLCVITLD